MQRQIDRHPDSPIIVNYDFCPPDSSWSPAYRDLFFDRAEQVFQWSETRHLAIRDGKLLLTASGLKKLLNTDDPARQLFNEMNILGHLANETYIKYEQLTNEQTAIRFNGRKIMTVAPHRLNFWMDMIRREASRWYNPRFYDSDGRLYRIEFSTECNDPGYPHDGYDDDDNYYLSDDSMDELTCQRPVKRESFGLHYAFMVPPGQLHRARSIINRLISWSNVFRCSHSPDLCIKLSSHL